MKPEVNAFFDKTTWTLTYVVSEPVSRDAVIIDPVLDYDPAASRVGIDALTRLVDFVNDRGLRPQFVLETHAHADHLTASQELKKFFPEVRVAIGARIVEVQKVFKEFYNFGERFVPDGRQFDVLLRDGELLEAGALRVRSLFTPGHTPACVSYLIDDAVFTGDALFMPDYGVGRCDFPAGSAEALYDSVAGRLYALPDETRVFTGHDYQPKGRALEYESTIGEEKRANVQLNGRTDKADFVRFRNERDRTLPPPALLLQSVQFNIAAGRMPAPESNGMRYLKIPLRR
jgi:glyoxylase-like metal-dependent hydrolase (beta-lactamase superfamily II)